jgi:hypothetical protein
MSKTVKLKLDAPVTYAALQSLTNISQETIFQALDGNKTAAAEVADFRIKQTQRAQNAKAVFGNLNQGLQATEAVMASNYGNPHAESILAYGIVTKHWTLTADIQH